MIVFENIVKWANIILKAIIPRHVHGRIYSTIASVMLICNTSHQERNAKSSDNTLTRRGRVRHICVSKLRIIGSDNGLLPGQHQAIIKTNAGILLIGPFGTNFGEIIIKFYIFSFKKRHLKMSSVILSQPQCVNSDCKFVAQAFIICYLHLVILK